MVSSEVEDIIGECIPICIKNILLSCGYDTVLSLENISIVNLKEIESHMNTHCRDVIQKFDCCHGEFYKAQTNFKLLPGHRSLILAVSKHIQKHFNEKNIAANLNLSKRIRVCLY